MGIAIAPDRIAVGGNEQIWEFEDQSKLAPAIEPAGRYDRCFLPRSITVTGNIHVHELAWGIADDGERELWVVNTLFSCLANLGKGYSFIPRWRPPFISTLAAEDRCHMNGLAMRDGRPAFVTAMSQTDSDHGYRPTKNTSGCVLDVASGEAVTSGMAMPHSPRWHGGRLLVLNSGYGTLELVELDSGRRNRIAAVPGFTRGLACHGKLAFVGLSRIRETKIFGGVPIAEHRDELRCGIGVIDLSTGATVATLQFEAGIEEIFDVQVLPGTRCLTLGESVGAGGERHDIWVVPPIGSEQPMPTGASADRLLGEALAAQAAGNADRALALLQQAATARPDSAEIANHLGNALQEAGRADDALAAYRRAALADPGFAPAFQNLGYLLVNRGRTDEGRAALARAQQAAPSPVNRLMLATALPVIYADADALRTQGERMRTEVAALVEEGVTIDTTTTLAPTNFLAAYLGADDHELQANLGRIFTGPDLVSARPGGAVQRDRDRPRIGFLSAYFRRHTIGQLNLGRVQQLSRERFEVVVLSASNNEDAITQDFERAADRFVRVPRTPADARAVIAAEELDLLLFTDIGMDALTYTLAFSRMAPVQATTWGHPTTTGSPAIDWFVSSDLLEIDGAEAHYTEQLARLPSLGTYYPRPQPVGGGDFRARLGVPETATLYACPQTLFKFNPEFDPLLAEILRRDPASRLVLIQAAVPYWTELLRARFARTMPDVAERIIWLPPLPRPAFWALLGAADVALDTIGFGGGNTSYETLAMGTPLVTLPGELMRSRITRALYAKTGLNDLVATSAENYVDMAVALGCDPEFRKATATRISESSDVLYEDAGEVRDLEDFFEQALGVA
jgi:uncharacterized protein (TIGR03032 family)